MDIDELTKRIIGAAIDVHRELGPGLFESTYEECLCYEFDTRGIPYKRQVQIPLVYKGKRLNKFYVLDLLVDDRVIIEIKCVDKLEKIHQAQMITYLRLQQVNVGLLINFKVPLLVQGVDRVVLNYADKNSAASAALR